MDKSEDILLNQLQQKHVSIFGSGCTELYIKEILIKNRIGTVEIYSGNDTLFNYSSHEDLRKILSLSDVVLDLLPLKNKSVTLITSAASCNVNIIKCFPLKNRSNPASFTVGNIFDIVANDESIKKFQLNLRANHIKNLQTVAFKESSDISMPTANDHLDCDTCKCPPGIARSCEYRRRSVGCNSYISAMAGMILSTLTIEACLNQDLQRSHQK
jgi:tRNA A37 threonylcarbamoyladenosine dehydratase